MKKLLFTIILLLFSIWNNALAQKQEKTYYDNSWKKTTAGNAKFYRLMDCDQKGKPTGIIKDYYITGELQMEAEAFFIDKINEDNNKWKKQIYYYKSGRKKRIEENYPDGKYLTSEDFFDMDEDISAHFKSFELIKLEQNAINYTYTFLTDVLQENDYVDFENDIKKEKNTKGEEVFTFYYKNTDNPRLSISFVDGNFLMLQFSDNYINEAEKELENSGFIKILSKNIIDEKTGKMSTLNHWSKENYPFKIIFLYSDDGKNYGHYVIAKAVSP